MKITLIALSLAVTFAAQAPAFADGDVVPAGAVFEGAMHDWNLVTGTS